LQTNQRTNGPNWSAHFAEAALASGHHLADAEVGKANILLFRPQVVPVEKGAVDTPLGTHKVAGVFAAPEIQALLVNVENDRVVSPGYTSLWGQSLDHTLNQGEVWS